MHIRVVLRISKMFCKCGIVHLVNTCYYFQFNIELHVHVCDCFYLKLNKKGKKILNANFRRKQHFCYQT